MIGARHVVFYNRVAENVKKTFVEHKPELRHRKMTQLEVRHELSIRLLVAHHLPKNSAQYQCFSLPSDINYSFVPPPFAI